MEVTEDAEPVENRTETVSPGELPGWVIYSAGALALLELLIYAGLVVTNAQPATFPWVQTLGELLGSLIGLLILAKVTQYVGSWVRVGDEDTPPFYSTRALTAISVVAILLSPVGALASTEPQSSGGFLVYGYVVAFAFVYVFAAPVLIAYNRLL